MIEVTEESIKALEIELRQKGDAVGDAVGAMNEAVSGLNGEIGDAAYRDIVDRWNELVAANVQMLAGFYKLFDMMQSLS